MVAGTATTTPKLAFLVVAICLIFSFGTIYNSNGMIYTTKATFNEMTFQYNYLDASSGEHTVAGMPDISNHSEDNEISKTPVEDTKDASVAEEPAATKKPQTKSDNKDDQDQSNKDKANTLSSQKLIHPGNHSNIPAPESRIGPNREVGYVHDPKFLINNPRPFHISEDEMEVCSPPGEGPELPEGYAALKKIRNHIETSKESRDVKLFCAVYTYTGGVNHTNAVSETWGGRCDGLLFASSASNGETGHMHLPSNSKFGFAYEGMFQRTRTILAYLYDNFLDEYDYFHICGDDAYLIVENLKEFLASEKVQRWEEVPDQYLFAGFWLHWGHHPVRPEGSFYLGGGSGYTLSRKALKAYVEGPLQTCKTHLETQKEDLFFSKCAKELNKKFIDTRDSSGAHRYHQLPVQRHSTFPGRRWGFSMSMIKQSLMHMERNFEFPAVYNDAYISNSSIAFHKHEAHELRRLELLLYKDMHAECGDKFTNEEKKKRR
jgi:glycoprotein-N-acetylgalactosamine 3-beta-galactosyltransferase